MFLLIFMTCLSPQGIYLVLVLDVEADFQLCYYRYLMLVSGLTWPVLCRVCV